MTCCDHGHTKMGDGGVAQTIPCGKHQYAPVMLRMIQSRREFLLGSSELINYRMWTAMTPHMMEGLPSIGMPGFPGSVKDFVLEYRFCGALDEENHGSGLCALMLSAMSGNATVLNELISQHNADVNARLKISMYEFGIEMGVTALTLGVGTCPQNNAHAVVAALIAAGADPNSTNKFGSTPLMAAALYKNVNGVRALLEYGGDTLDLEKGLKANRATALSLAAFTSTTEIVEALVQAGANRRHIEDGGGSKLTDAASNPAADVRMLELLCGPSDGDHSLSSRRNINDQMKPRTAKFRLIDLACQKGLWLLGGGTSLLMMGRAHCEGATPLHLRHELGGGTSLLMTDSRPLVGLLERGATPLHFAARSGNAKLARWLLLNGAEPSLFVKNRMGCLPIDLARVFGPHAEVEGLLGAAMIKTMQQQSDQPTNRLTRKAMMKQLASSALQTARSGETAIEVQFPMVSQSFAWVYDAVFMTLSVYDAVSPPSG